MKKFPLFLMTVTVMLLLVARADGQVDSLSRMRQLLKICNVYGRLPISATVSMSNIANFVMEEEDTAQVVASCYVNSNSFYVSFGEVEQLANDSLLLLVNRRVKRMMLSQHPESVSQKMNDYLGLFAKDSSVTALSRDYMLSPAVDVKDTAGMVLVSKKKIFQTAMALDSIFIRYSRKDSQLLETRRVRRSLVRLNEDDYRDLRKQGAYPGAMISAGDTAFFLVRSRQSVCTYLRVSHDPGDKAPALVYQRIEADPKGGYRPVVSFSDYVIANGY